MISKFHKDFRERYRGSREEIKTRFLAYLPLLEPLRNAYADVSVVDLGCGRGEWLETLKENGFSAQGIDLENGVLGECRELGLSVHAAEALSFLQKLPDESQVVVSSFHMVEHLPFDDLKDLVKESLRVLKPAGLLILETPNPENIVVGSSAFYMDPTHQKPIPPNLLAFLPEYFGFKTVKILRLNEASRLTADHEISLLDVLNGVSPDYAVIAQKQTDNESLDLDVKFFDTNPGLTLEFLATLYEQKLKSQLKSLRVDLDRLEKRLVREESELQAISNSKCWRITWPLRKLMDGLKRLFSLIKQIMLWIINLPKGSPGRRHIRNPAPALENSSTGGKSPEWLDQPIKTNSSFNRSVKPRDQVNIEVQRSRKDKKPQSRKLD